MTMELGAALLRLSPMKVHGQILDVARGFSLCERVEAESSWMETLKPGREAAAERALQWLSVAVLLSTNDSRSARR